MSRNGQTTNEQNALPIITPITDAELDVDRAIVTASESFRRPGTTKRHTHTRAQLLFAAHGTLTTAAGDGTWVAPPERTIWIPAGLPHVTSHSTGTELRSIFFRTEEAAALPKSFVVMQVSSLARELFLAVMRLPRLYDESGPEGRLVNVLIDQLIVLPEEPLHLPLPSSRKLRAIALRQARHKLAATSLAKAAEAVSMTPRTFARHFQNECGMSYGAWLRQARLLRALELLGAGKSVGDVAFTLGYESTSAFIAMFRSAFGKTPAGYFQK
jgi:AraC-like DNA-binding protein